MQIIEHSTRHPNTQNKTVFQYKKKIVLQKLVFYSRVGREKQEVVVGLSLTPVGITVRSVAKVSIAVRPVAVSVVSVPGIGLSLRTGSSISSGLSISRPLSIVVSISIRSVAIVSIAVWPVSVVSVPGISLGLRTGSGIGSGLSISRSLKKTIVNVLISFKGVNKSVKFYPEKKESFKEAFPMFRNF